MGRRLILDTGVLVAWERQRARLSDIVSVDDDVAVASITVAELWAGVELASPERRLRREAFVEALLRIVSVEPHDERVARIHGELLTHVHRTGSPRGAHDLAIAAVAVATGRVLVTTDERARWGDLPGVRHEVHGL